MKNNCLLLNYTKLLNQGLPKLFDAEFNSATIMIQLRQCDGEIHTRIPLLRQYDSSLWISS